MKITRMMSQLLLLPSVSQASLSFLSEAQEDSIRKWAKAANLGTCPGSDATPSATELDFAHDAAIKFFTLDANSQDSWEILSGVQSCLEKTTGLSWLGGKNLYQAAQTPFETFAAHVNKAQWDGAGNYLENNPKLSTQFGVWSKAGPMGSYANASRELWLSQPCNAFSNAAYYEIALELCHYPDVPALPGGWTWGDEVKAISSILAFGSFAMHSNGFNLRNPPPGHTGGWAPVDTQLLDTFAMDLLFYMFHQASVYNLASTSADASSLTGVLTMGGTGPPDARVPIREAMQIFQQPIETWHVPLSAFRSTVPMYMQSAVGIVLVNLNMVFHKQLFGNAGSKMYTLACMGIFDALMPGDTKNSFCPETSAFYQALAAVKWKVPKSISKCLSTLVNHLEIIVEAFYWQEEKAKPTNYLDPWKQNNTVSPTKAECWRMPHSNWHRCGALLSSKLVKLFTSELRTMVTDTSEVTAAMKQAAWDDAASVAASFSVMLNSVKAMMNATTVNMCAVFKLAKDCASSKPFCGPPAVLSLLAPAKLNEMLSGLLTAYDPLTTQELGKGDLKVPLSMCNHSWNATLKKVAGLSNFGFSALDVKTEYVEGSTLDSTVIRANISLATCDLGVQIQGSGWVTSKQTDKFGSGSVCPALEEVGLEVNAALQMGVAATVIVDANLNKILSGVADGAFSLDLSAFKLKCHDVTLIPQKEGWHAKVSYDIVNAALDVSLTELGCDIINKVLTPKLAEQVSAAAQQMGSMTASAMGSMGGRRMQGSAVSNTCKPLDEQMIAMFGQATFDRHLKTKLKPQNFGLGSSTNSTGGAFLISAACSSRALGALALAMIGSLM